MFEDKRVLVFGVANERSIAWAISRAMHEQGARLAFTFAGDILERRVRPLAESIGADMVLPCDVTSDSQIDAVFRGVHEMWNGLDVLIHAVAFAGREDMAGRFVDTSREGFLNTMDISAFSLVRLARGAAPLMAERGGSILTLSYHGARQVVPGYNVMGVAKAALEASVRYLAYELGQQQIRVNAISAGPVKTLAASGIKGFRGIFAAVEERAPLRRNITHDDVAKSAVFLCSDMGSGVTGEILYVDAGFNVVAI